MSEIEQTNSGHPLDRFRKALAATQILDPEQIGKLIERLTSQPELSPFTALLESGLCTQSDIELVELWLAADSGIPGYQLIDLIGRGGMGVVWRAKQVSLDRVVAMKMISATQNTNQIQAARFEREAAAIAKLSHPNVVTALDFGSFGNRLFLVMEYVAGEDLDQYVDRVGRLSESRSLSLIRQIAAGLSHASRYGVIHRDIKPANILLVNHQDSDGQPAGVPLAKITDFGLALFQPANQAPEARLTIDQSTVGSPHYMAPDQMNGLPVDTRTDIYSLGATLFHLLTGQAPWHGKPLTSIVRDKLSGTFSLDELKAARISPSVIDLIRRMTDADPARRPASCQQLLIEIDQIIERPSDNREFNQHHGPITQDSFTLDYAPTANQSTNELAATQPIRFDQDEYHPFSRNVLSSGATTNQPLPRYPFSLRRSKTFWFAGGLLVMILTIAGAWKFLGGESSKPIALVLAGEQKPLFDGVTLPLDAITEGEIVASKGRIELGGTRMSIFGYRLNDWEYYRLEAAIEVPPGATLDVAMGGNIFSKHVACNVIRFEANQVRLGSLARVGGEYSSTHNAIELESGRTRHFLEIEKNRNCWIVRVNRDFENQFIVPFNQPPEQLEILFIAIPQKEPHRGNTIDSRTAISELTISKMQPDS